MLAERRVPAAFSLPIGTLDKLNAFVASVRLDPRLRAILSLAAEDTGAGPGPVFTDGLSAENYAELRETLKAPGPIATAAELERCVNAALRGGCPLGVAKGVIRRIEVMQRANRALARRHQRAVERAADHAARRSATVNTSRVVEALILLGIGSLENTKNVGAKSLGPKSRNAGKAA